MQTSCCSSRIKIIRTVPSPPVCHNLIVSSLLISYLHYSGFYSLIYELLAFCREQLKIELQLGNRILAPIRNLFPASSPHPPSPLHPERKPSPVPTRIFPFCPWQFAKPNFAGGPGVGPRKWWQLWAGSGASTSGLSTARSSCLVPKAVADEQIAI